MLSGRGFLILAAGAPGVNAAFVFLFNPDTGVWSQNARLTTDNEIDDLFGRSVSVYDNQIFVGAPGTANDAGAVHEFVASLDQSGTTVIWANRSKVSFQ